MKKVDRIEILLNIVVVIPMVMGLLLYTMDTPDWFCKVYAILSLLIFGLLWGVSYLFENKKALGVLNIVIAVGSAGLAVNGPDYLLGLSGLSTLIVGAIDLLISYKG